MFAMNSPLCTLCSAPSSGSGPASAPDCPSRSRATLSPTFAAPAVAPHTHPAAVAISVYGVYVSRKYSTAYSQCPMSHVLTAGHVPAVCSVCVRSFPNPKNPMTDSSAMCNSQRATASVSHLPSPAGAPILPLLPDCRSQPHITISVRESHASPHPRPASALANTISCIHRSIHPSFCVSMQHDNHGVQPLPCHGLRSLSALWHSAFPPHGPKPSLRIVLFS